VNDVSSWTTLGPILAIVLGATGTFLMLPHRHGATKPAVLHWVGAGLAALGLLFLASLWSAPGPLLSRLFFYAFSFCAIGGGVLMITSRDPVHSALWFAAVVLATSGLFLESGAQFLAAGTVIVYAGAIIVTFLFVIMLAQAEGQAAYDRAARSPAAATLTSFLLLWCVMYALLSAKNVPTPTGSEPSVAQIRPEPAAVIAQRHDFRATHDVARVLDQAVSRTARLPQPARVSAPAPPHVASLGGTLYTDNLIAVEVAGAILFVALVGAAAIATPKPPVRPSTAPRTS
jgi:NADH-quinone oxidoreductase subunit J